MSVPEFIDEQPSGGLDLYDDILREDFECEKDSINKLQQKYQEAIQKITTLENTVEGHVTAMEILEKKNTNLQKNILTLYKTACSEIKRKSHDIRSLREQIESHEKQKQSGYSQWNSHYQKNNKTSQRDQRDTKESDRKDSRYYDAKNPKYSDKYNSRHSGSRERRYDDRRQEEKHSSHRDLQKSEAKDNRSLEWKSSRHSKNRTNSSREHKREISRHHCQRTPSSTGKSSSHAAPFKEKHNLSDSSEFGNAKRQDSKLIDCQQSVEPINKSTQLSVKSAGSDVESKKSSAGKFSRSDKHENKMCDPVATSPELTTKCDRNLSPVISENYKTSTAFNSPEPIVIECFGRSNLEDSHSPIIIPCFSSSVTNSRTCESKSSDDDSDCDDDATPKKKTIVRKLFSPSKPECNADDMLAKNYSLEFLNEMKRKLSQEIAAHNRSQQDEDCADTTQLVDIYQTPEDEYCNNDSVRDQYSPQPQNDLPAVTQQDDKGKVQTSKEKFSPSQIKVSSATKKLLSKHNNKHGSKHTSRKHSKKRNFSGDETLSKIRNKQNNSSRTENKRRRVNR